MKKLILLVIVAGVVYLNYTNPTREDHEALLFAELQALGPITEEQFANAVKTIDYSSFMICSATKTSEDSKPISFGYLKQVKLANDQWTQKVAQKIRAQQGY